VGKCAFKLDVIVEVEFGEEGDLAQIVLLGLVGRESLARFSRSR
jgi:hypothetical protein